MTAERYVSLSATRGRPRCDVPCVSHELRWVHKNNTGIESYSNVKSYHLQVSSRSDAAAPIQMRLQVSHERKLGVGVVAPCGETHGRDPIAELSDQSCGTRGQMCYPTDARLPGRPPALPPRSANHRSLRGKRARGSVTEMLGGTASTAKSNPVFEPDPSTASSPRCKAQ